MTIEQKKEHILRCIKLGMEFYQSALVAECTEQEIEQLQNDELFQHIIIVKQALQEEELLRKHDVGLEIAKNKGNTKPIEWRLSKLNKRYENATKIKTDEKIPMNFNISLKGEYPDNTSKESGN